MNVTRDGLRLGQEEEESKFQYAGLAVKEAKSR